MVQFGHLIALLKRYYICYFRVPGHFMGDFLLGIVVGTCLALIGILPQSFISALGVLVFFFLVPFTYMGVTRSSIAEIVQEKVLNIKEYLKLNGVNNSTYQAYCFSIASYKMFIQCGLICAGVAIGFSGSIYQDSQIFSFAQMAALYVLSACANLAFILFMSTLFQEPKFASDIGGFLYVIVSLGSFAVFSSDNSLPYYLVCLFPQSGLTMGILLSLRDFHTQSGFGINQVYMMLGIDFGIYMILYWYFDQVIRDGNGVKKGYFFFLTCCCERKKKRVKVNDEQAQKLMKETDQGEGEKDSSAIFEEPFNPMGRKRTVQLEKLARHFGDLRAVDGVDLSVYEGQIMCLLGHNGAGKTTTINLMTGLLEPSSGDIYYDGISFFDDVEEARAKIGLCCQKDIIYDKLTVKEHLELIAKLRKIPTSDQPEAVHIAIQKMNLTAEAEKRAETLSGGNKRKLCLAMAVLGHTKVIFLDEPTSGMDPNNRRIIWQHIKELRDNGLTILMTTHHLDEADELAERIAIMSHGKLMALGSSDFMKRKFGVGYYL